MRRYVARGQLPALGQIIARHGLAETVSEDKYEELEPWIQWVSAHTGLTFAEHKVFRLGDIVQHEHEQIWEKLEADGVTVAAVSPINGANRTRRSPTELGPRSCAIITLSDANAAEAAACNTKNRNPVRTSCRA